MNYSEICTLSGILKIAEIITIFIALIIHRFGDGGNYLFFGTTASKLSMGDDGIDVENLGNGTLVTFIVIASCLLMTYVIDGRHIIQALFLEPLWNFIAMFLFMGTGVMTVINWSGFYQDKSYRDLTRNKDAGLALGGICIWASILYFTDFIYSFSARRRLLRDPY